MMSILKPDIQQTVSVKPMINIGACLDIPTGFYIKGKYGESLLNGGLGMLTGIAGIGNNFKSTILHYMMLSAANKVAKVHETNMTTYDTEINIHENRLRQFASMFDSFRDTDILEDQTWVVTDKTVYYGDEFYHKLVDYLSVKKKNANSLMLETPFMDRKREKLNHMMVPTFSEIDSLSEFETKHSVDVKDKHDLGDSGRNTLFMRQGLIKSQLLMDLPTLAWQSNHYILMTAHIGKETQMANGPIPVPPTKKLIGLKNGDKIKGVSDRFFFLTNNFWHTYHVTPLINQSTKAPEYPLDSVDNSIKSYDLNLIYLKQLRCKSGPSGNTVELVVSQTQGVLPTLTEFHHIKESKRYGISGTLQHYYLDLIPDVKLSRTTVRGKIDDNVMLRRAINITSEMCQIKDLWRDMDDRLVCTPKELYEDLKKDGYDWNVLLNTRGWWSYNNDQVDLPFLSTMDLLNMRAKLYKPYWYK